MTDSTWVHNLDPFIVQFTGNIGIRWYSMAYLTGFALAFVFMSWLSKKKRTPMTLDMVSDFLTYLIVGVLLGGRLGYVFFYSPDLLTDFRPTFPYWGAIAVWEGGMASHGGFIGVVIACLLFAWKHKLDPLHLGDLTMIGGSLGIFLGRIANFMNGELMGRVASEKVAWAVKFPQDMYRWIGYETHRLSSLVGTVKEIGISESEWTAWIQNRSQGRMFDAADRIINAIQQGNVAVTNAIAPILEPRHPSQIYGALAEGLIPCLILLWIWRKPRKPGLICGLYLLIYSASRVIDEMFRLPDAHLSDLSQLPLGLTRGQFLSLGLIIGGVLILVLAYKRKSPLMGGLLTGEPVPETTKVSAKRSKKKK